MFPPSQKERNFMASVAAAESARASSSSSLLHPSDLPLPSDVKTSKVRDKIFPVIRNSFPIETLFDPKLKINLKLFLDDQFFFYRLAKVLSSIDGEINIESIRQHLEGHELLSLLKAKFKDPDLYLPYFFEACVRALRDEPHETKSLEEALRGRVFSLRNALVAQCQPNALQRSQKSCGLRSQDLDSIKEEGAVFICESLRLYMSLFRNEAEGSFEESLKNVTTKLAPFTRSITESYLKENGRDYRQDLLLFRNPSGYNSHGLTAAFIMEACLRVLGYQARVLMRSDLDPKVTLATAHSVVEVIGPEGDKYVVDPCYRQFYKDICLDNEALPEDPVLVLREDQVSGYVESKLMSRWRNHRDALQQGDQTLADRLIKHDQILPFFITKVGKRSELMDPQREPWVRGSLEKLWDLATYSPIFSNRGFEEVFYGTGDTCQTYNHVKGMNIPALAGRSSVQDLRTSLDRLLEKRGLEGKNDQKALSLIAHLPRQERSKYNSFYDADQVLARSNRTIDTALNAYYRTLERLVNPNNEDLRVIYGCSGADCISVLLSTNPKNVVMIDMTEVKISDFINCLEAYKRDRRGYFERLFGSKFFEFKLRYSGSVSTYDGINHRMENLAAKLLFDLSILGVNLDDVVFSEDAEGIHVDFEWQYYGNPELKTRRITFLTADLTNPQEYPATLRHQLEKGLDIFFMKSAFLVPESYPEFLPHIVRSMNAGGWMMTTDKTCLMEEIDPEPCLEKSGFLFSRKKSEETCLIEGVLEPPFDPFIGMPSLEFFPPSRRANRTIGSDLSYWALLNLRQKSSEAEVVEQGGADGAGRSAVGELVQS